MKSCLSLVLAALLCAPLLAADNAKLEEYFKKLDANGDGKLSLAEFKGKAEGDRAAKMEERFKKMDKNSDGSVTLEEFIAGINTK